MLENLKRDIPYIENKYHKTSEPFNPFNRMQYHGWDCDGETGLDDAEMQIALADYINTLTETDRAVIKAKAFAFVLDNMRISINEHDFFPCLYNWNRPLNNLLINRWAGEEKRSPESQKFRDEYTRSGDIAIWMDFDHSVPDWHALYKLGFPGIIDRARKYRDERAGLTDKESAYFDSIEITYSAILRLISRLRDYAKSCDFEKAPFISECLGELCDGAPRTLFGRLMLIYLYFLLSESVDSFQVRSLGSGLDYDLTEPYRADLASGKFTVEQLDEFIGYFLMQFSAIGNYWGQPLYIGGSNFDGSCKVNEISYKLLEIYDELGIYNPKIQVKYAKNTPDMFLGKICDMIRRGHSSFVFVCEDNARENFISHNIPYEQCWDFDVRGCYEYTIRGREVSTGAFYVNLLGAVVRALNNTGGNDSWEEILHQYFLELGKIFEGGIKAANEMESQIAFVNPSPMFSGTIEHSLKIARDAYFDGSEYNNSSIIIGGLGSAADALAAIKYLVFDNRLTTLAGLKKVLSENWSDANLRAHALKCPKKFGCGDDETDTLAAKICEFIVSYQNSPNSRGGYYKTELHSARQFINLGEKTPATPDGRLAGDETSKNASPTQGMDRNGVTALIRSALKTKPARHSEGYGFDVMLHETAVSGGDGLDAMRGLLAAYEAGGGSSIQFIVCDAKTLREAQSNPQKYQSLQIRVCGWNVLWNNMPKSEQDKYIERAENLA